MVGVAWPASQASSARRGARARRMREAPVRVSERRPGRCRDGRVDDRADDHTTSRRRPRRARDRCDDRVRDVSSSSSASGHGDAGGPSDSDAPIAGARSEPASEGDTSVIRLSAMTRRRASAVGNTVRIATRRAISTATSGASAGLVEHVRRDPSESASMTTTAVRDRPPPVRSASLAEHRDRFDIQGVWATGVLSMTNRSRPSKRTYIPSAGSPSLNSPLSRTELATTRSIGPTDRGVGRRDTRAPRHRGAVRPPFPE